jgi:hypothetical protein
MTKAGHHPKIPAASHVDRRNAAAYRLWLVRLASRHCPVDPRTQQQRDDAAIHYESSLAVAQFFLACRAERIRQEIKRAARRGLRVVNGGKR